jgi:hypothetical protein
VGRRFGLGWNTDAHVLSVFFAVCGREMLWCDENRVSSLVTGILRREGVVLCSLKFQGFTHDMVTR